MQKRKFVNTRAKRHACQDCLASLKIMAKVCVLRPFVNCLSQLYFASTSNARWGERTMVTLIYNRDLTLTNTQCFIMNCTRFISQTWIIPHPPNGKCRPARFSQSHSLVMLNMSVLLLAHSPRLHSAEVGSLSRHAETHPWETDWPIDQLVMVPWRVQVSVWITASSDGPTISFSNIFFHPSTHGKWFSMNIFGLNLDGMSMKVCKRVRFCWI